MSIVGLGGTGKTQVALQFAYMIKEMQLGWSVFWVPAVSIESFEQACAKIAHILEISITEEDDARELVRCGLVQAKPDVGCWLSTTLTTKTCCIEHSR